MPKTKMTHQQLMEKLTTKESYHFIDQRQKGNKDVTSNHCNCFEKFISYYILRYLQHPYI